MPTALKYNCFGSEGMNALAAGVTRERIAHEQRAIIGYHSVVCKAIMILRHG
jgi:hypothetical protein